MGRNRLRLVLPFALAACGARDSARIDSAAGERNVTGRTLRVAILGAPDDPRIPAVREVIGHWNGELARVGLPVRFDSGSISNAPVPEDALRASSGAKLKPWSGFI